MESKITPAKKLGLIKGDRIVFKQLPAPYSKFDEGTVDEITEDGEMIKIKHYETIRGVPFAKFDWFVINKLDTIKKVKG